MPEQLPLRCFGAVQLAFWTGFGSPHRKEAIPKLARFEAVPKERPFQKLNQNTRQNKRIHFVWKASIITRQGQWQQHIYTKAVCQLSCYLRCSLALPTSERQMSKAGDRINRSFSFDTLYIPHLAAGLPMLTSCTLSSLRIKQYDRLPQLFTKLFSLARH